MVSDTRQCLTRVPTLQDSASLLQRRRADDQPFLTNARRAEQGESPGGQREPKSTSFFRPLPIPRASWQGLWRS
jgi:hypothetical protein